MERYVTDVLVTMAERGAAPIAGGAVDVEGDTVVWSGPVADAPHRAELTVHDVGGMLIPGFVNIHCHTPMVLLRGAGEGLPVDRWLEEVMWPREAKLMPDDVEVGMLAGGAELLTGGVTTSVEMYFHGQAVANAAAALGLRCVVTAPIIEDDQLGAFGTWQEQLDEMVEMTTRWAEHPLIDVGIGPHAAYSVSDECLGRISEVALERGMLIHIHVAEQEWEAGPIRDRSGMSAPAYLESLGMLEGDVLAAHCVWMSDEDIEVFGRHGVGVAHCPCSNTKHASGVAPVHDMTTAGIGVGLGTDGPASHHRLDVFEEMRMAVRLARVISGDAQRLSTDDALWMATAGAADAIGREDIGRLVAGAKADMIAIDTTGPAFLPKVPSDDDPIGRVVWSGSPASVAATWVGGTKVAEQGCVATIDEREVRSEMTKRARTLADV